MLSQNDAQVSQILISKNILTTEKFQEFIRNSVTREAFCRGISLLVLLKAQDYIPRETFEEILLQHFFTECQDCQRKTLLLESSLSSGFRCKVCSGPIQQIPLEVLELPGNTDPSDPQWKLIQLLEIIKDEERIARQILNGEEDPLVGKILGNCQIIRKLGEGGMGVVYLGQHLHLKNQVALKVMSQKILGPKSIERFFLEARSIAQIDHPQRSPNPRRWRRKWIPFSSSTIYRRKISFRSFRTRRNGLEKRC